MKHIALPMTQRRWLILKATTKCDLSSLSTKNSDHELYKRHITFSKNRRLRLQYVYKPIALPYMQFVETDDRQTYANAFIKLYRKKSDIHYINNKTIGPRPAGSWTANVNFV